MKRIVLICLFMAFASASLLYAGGYYTTLVGGYTTASMSQVNSDIIGNGSGPGVTNIQLGSGMYFGVDGMLMSQEGLGLHLRAEYVYISPGEIKYANGTPDGNYQYADAQVSPYMIPLLLGLSYTFHSKGDRFSLTAGIYGGITDAYLDYYQHTIDSSGNDSMYDLLFESWGFCAEGAVSLNYWFTQHFSFGLQTVS